MENLENTRKTIITVAFVEKIEYLGLAWHGFSTGFWKQFCAKQDKNETASPKEPLKACFHRGFVEGGTENSGFTSPWWALHEVLWKHVLRSHFTKRFTKRVLALPIKLFMELKLKTKACRAKLNPSIQINNHEGWSHWLIAYAICHN